MIILWLCFWLLGESWFIDGNIADLISLIIFTIVLSQRSVLVLNQLWYLFILSVLIVFRNSFELDILVKSYVIFRPVLFLYIFNSLRVRMCDISLFFKVGLVTNGIMILLQYFGILLPIGSQNWYAVGNPGFGGVFSWTISLAYFSFFAFYYFTYVKKNHLMTGVAFLCLLASMSLYYIGFSVLLILFKVKIKRASKFIVLSVFTVLFSLLYSSEMLVLLRESLMFSRLGIVLASILFLWKGGLYETLFGIGLDSSLLYDRFDALNIVIPHVMKNNIVVGLEDMLLVGGAVMFGLIIWALIVGTWARFLFKNYHKILALAVLLGLGVNQNLYSGFFVVMMMTIYKTERINV